MADTDSVEVKNERKLSFSFWVVDRTRQSHTHPNMSAAAEKRHTT